jgi:hypothetical protein
MMEPRAIRPGVRIAFVRAPDNVRIELLGANLATTPRLT